MRRLWRRRLHGFAGLVVCTGLVIIHAVVQLDRHWQESPHHEASLEEGLHGRAV